MSRESPPSVGAARGALAQSGSVGHRTPNRRDLGNHLLQPPLPPPPPERRGNRGREKEGLAEGTAEVAAPRQESAARGSDSCSCPPPPARRNLSRAGARARPRLFGSSPPSAPHPPAPVGSALGVVPCLVFGLLSCKLIAL